MLAFYIIAYLLLILLAWAIGSVNFAIVIFYIKRKEDIRTKCSKNAGGSNVGRTLGRKWGILVVLCDMMKVPLAMLVALGFSFIKSGYERKFWGVISFYLVGAIVILGHIWPIFFQLRGGKGVACFCGLTWVTNPWWFLIFALLWFLFFFITRKSFLASIGSIALTAICAWIPQISQVDNLVLSYTDLSYLLKIKFIWFNQFHQLSTPKVGDSFLTMQLVVTITAAIICAKHRSNIKQWFKNYKFKLKKVEKEVNNHKIITTGPRQSIFKATFS